MQQQRSPYFIDQYSRNRLARDLMLGLRAVRGGNMFAALTGAAIQQSPYLPKFPEEPEHVYANRVNQSFLVNYFRRAVESDTGKVVSAPIKIEQEGSQPLPDEFYVYLDDMDMDGKDIDVFAKDQLQAALYKGVTICFVDFVSDDQRPFVKEIDIDDVLEFDINRRTGRLTRLKWQDTIIDDSDDLTQVETKNAYWEVTPTTWALYLDDNDVPEDSGDIVRYKNDGSKRITDELPISIMYTNKKGTLLAESPYQGLAELTIEHFQVSSDIKNILHYALTPMLFAKGLPEDVKVSALAAWQAVILDDSNLEAIKDADIKWVQADAAPIEQARETIKDIEYRISSFAVDSSAIRPSGNVTATEAAINAAGSNAALRRFASAVSSHIQRVISIMASYYPMQDLTPEVTVSSDFDLSDNSDKAKVALESFKEGLISGKTATDVFIQQNILPRDYDYQEDALLIKDVSAIDNHDEAIEPIKLPKDEVSIDQQEDIDIEKEEMQSEVD